jgi:hypothetical protein
MAEQAAIITAKKGPDTVSKNGAGYSFAGQQRLGSNVFLAKLYPAPFFSLSRPNNGVPRHQRARFGRAAAARHCAGPCRRAVMPGLRGYGPLIASDSCESCIYSVNARS